LEAIEEQQQTIHIEDTERLVAETERVKQDKAFGKRNLLKE
jgi:hypothetical protein